LESQISLAALIQVSRSQTYDKRTFRGVAHWHFVLNELRPHQCQSLGFHSETPSRKTPTNLKVDGYFVQAEAFECRNGPHTLLLISLFMLFTAKRNLSQESPFRVRTWIAGPFQNLNLKRR